MIEFINDKTFLLLFGFTKADVALQAAGSQDLKAHEKLRPDEIAGKLELLTADTCAKDLDFTLQELSRKIDVSERTLRNYFKFYQGQNFRQWKMNVRIEEAKGILKNEPWRSIESISKEIGFEDKSNFHRQFRRITGYTPNEWKKL